MADACKGVEPPERTPVRSTACSALTDLKMQIVELLYNANDDEMAEHDLNLYNALIENPDVMERMGNKLLHPADDPNHVHPHYCGYTMTGHIHNCDCKPECATPHDETPKQACGDCDPCLGGRPDQCALTPNAELCHREPKAACGGKDE